MAAPGFAFAWKLHVVTVVGRSDDQCVPFPNDLATPLPRVKLSSPPTVLVRLVFSNLSASSRGCVEIGCCDGVN